MKYLILMGLLLTMISCKKNNTANSNTPNTTNPQISTPPTASSTSTNSLYGKWILKQTSYYDEGGNELDYTNYYNANTYYVNLQIAISTAPAFSTPGYSAAVDGLNGVTVSTGWKIVDTTTIDINGIVYTILFRNTDSLSLISAGGPIIGGSKLTILSKKPGFFGQRPMELLLKKHWTILKQVNLSLLANPTTSAFATITYTNPILNYIDLGNQWVNIGTGGWSCLAGFPLGNNTQGYYEVINDSILIGSPLYGKIDTITPNKLVITGPTYKYVMN